MLFPQFAAETKETMRPGWPLSPGLPLPCLLLTRQAPLKPQSPSGQRSRVPCRDLGPEADRDSLRKHDTGQGRSPWENSGTGDSYRGLGVVSPTWRLADCGWGGSHIHQQPRT